MAIFGGGPPNLEGIKYFDLIFCHDHLLTKPNICAEFEKNRWFELYHLLPGFLMDTLLTYWRRQNEPATCDSKSASRLAIRHNSNFLSNYENYA